MSEVRISVARDYSVFPAGRLAAKAKASGEGFRERILIPAFKKASIVIVDLDGTRGYDSSFLEEAFGGLVRRGIIGEDYEDHLVITSSNPSYLEEVKLRISSALQKKRSNKENKI